MPPCARLVPQGSFAYHSKHLQHRRPSSKRFASQLAAPERPLWRGQDPVSRIGQSITGGMEWQTSAYSFNKQNIKTLPIAAANVQKLIEGYATMKKIGTENRDPRAVRTALAARRKSPDKVYVSKPKVKDFGDRIELTAFFFDGKEAARDADEKRQGQRGRAGQSSPAVRRSQSDFLFDPAQQAGLQSLIARIYGKPVELKLIKLRKPHLDADILATVVAQRLRDRRNTPRRIIRDATWKAPLPTHQVVENILQAKHQRQANHFSWSDFTLGNTSQTTATSIMDSLAISQISSIEVEAAGRLTKRLTANRSQRKMARRGASAKQASVMLRGFKKAHVQYAFAGGKRRVGQFGISVRLGHA